MNWRKSIYLNYASLRGYRFPALLARYAEEYRRGAGRETTLQLLTGLLRHCKESVPYYAELLRDINDDRDPMESLRRLPVLTKETIRSNFEKLKSNDLHRRKWYYNTSGGSTGKPVRLIQDREYADRGKAISLLYHILLGCDICQPLVTLWGSERDLEMGAEAPAARFFNWLTRTVWMNAFRMSTERMRGFVEMLNQMRPNLIVAYTQSAYELAQFVERERLPLKPQRAIVTTAGTLYPFMRERIARAFGCNVYNQYGSREVSVMGCEVPGIDGLWVPPWSNFIEILDDDGMPLPDGEEGNIVVTCLTNFAMPLLRYQIGDRGSLMPNHTATDHAFQVFKQVSGRNMDVFRSRNETLVDAQYFIHLMYFRPWVEKFQVIQKDYEHILFKIVKLNGGPDKRELDEITAKSRLALGNECRVDFEFHTELPPHPSGKYRYTISEVRSLS